MRRSTAGQSPHGDLIRRYGGIDPFVGDSGGVCGGGLEHTQFVCQVQLVTLGLQFATCGDRHFERVATPCFTCGVDDAFTHCIEM